MQIINMQNNLKTEFTQWQAYRLKVSLIDKK